MRGQARFVKGPREETPRRSLIYLGQRVSGNSRGDGGGVVTRDPYGM
jgi:hypothetical protein